MCTHNNCTKIVVIFSNLKGINYNKMTNVPIKVGIINIYFQNEGYISICEKMWLYILTTLKRGRIMKYSTAIVNKCL